MTTQMIDPEPSAYVTLLAGQRAVGISRGTLKEYPTYLGIEPISFRSGTRSLSRSREAITQVKHLKLKPALLVQLPSPVLSYGSSARKDTSNGH